MKKITLLLSLAVSVSAVNAQYAIHGSSYTQNFDGIGSGLPTGWSVYNGASAHFIGSPVTLVTLPDFPSVLRPDTASCIGLVSVGGFKNFPSATVSHPGDDYCAVTPPTYTNRALGVRQVAPTNMTHPNLDSGAAFVFELNNTSGVSNLALSFKLQSLDTSSSRTTTWLVDYAVGTTASFTPAPTVTGTWTTGGNTFSSNTCTANFGSALDNKTQPVYIRIVTLVFSSGSGNRASSAIDDYSLTWTGTPTGVTNVTSEQSLAFSVLGAAATDKVTFGYSVATDADYALAIYDLSGRVLHTENITAKTGGQQITIDGLHLVPGMYFAKMSNANSSSVARIMVN